jgi:hypothetical protein
MAGRQLTLVKQEIGICNFVSVNIFNPEHIPNTLKEVMAEMNTNPQVNLNYPCIGMVVKSKRDYPPINVKKGDSGIIVSLYGERQNGVMIIFSNGEHSGFSNEETIEDLEFSHLTKHEHIKNYIYTSSAYIYHHYEVGIFDA